LLNISVKSVIVYESAKPKIVIEKEKEKEKEKDE
jgi:hypothetical protein